MVLESEVLRRMVKHFPGSSRESVSGSVKLVEEGVGGGGARICLGCMYSGRCSFKNV
jgi:hypothetical protein